MKQSNPKPIITPLTPKEQALLIFMGSKSITFKGQGIYRDRHSFCHAIKRLSERQPSLIKARREYTNDSKTSFKLLYKLTFDARILVRTYLLPAAAIEATEENNNGG